MRELEPILELLWLWAAAPLAAIAAAILTVRLGFPQLMRLGDAVRGARTVDDDAEGTMHPGASAALAAVATYGTAGAIGAATAVSLGGAGAVAWVWLFALVFMPLRMGEAALARTAPPGKAGEATGTLAGRLLDDPIAGLRAAGWALIVLIPLAGFAFFGGTHGEAIVDTAQQLAPDSAMPIAIGVAAVGFLLAVLPLKRVGAIAGWTAVVAFLALFTAGIVALLSDPGKGFGSLGRALIEAIQEAPPAAGFSGALVGEIAMGALMHALPPLAGASGVASAWHAQARAKTTRQQASTALLGPLVYGVLTTVVGLSLVATNAFARPVEGSRPIRDLTFYTVDFDTVSQRQETDRLMDGIFRPTDGDTGVVEVHAGTERGMVLAPRFTDMGEPANIALRIVEGRATEVQRPGPMDGLEAQPESALDDIAITGRMLPRGASLVAAATQRGGGDVMRRVALAALLLLAALGLMAWGGAIALVLRTRLPANVARFAAVLPAAGLGVSAAGLIPGLSDIGLLIAALLTIITSVVLIVRARDVQKLLEKKKS